MRGSEDPPHDKFLCNFKERIVLKVPFFRDFSKIYAKIMLKSGAWSPEYQYLCGHFKFTQFFHEILRKSLEFLSFQKQLYRLQ